MPMNASASPGPASAHGNSAPITGTTRGPASVLAPLSQERFRLQATLSRQGRDALIEAQRLTGHGKAKVDLARVIETAIVLYRDQLMARKFGTKKSDAARTPRLQETASSVAVAADFPRSQPSNGLPSTSAFAAATSEPATATAATTAAAVATAATTIAASTAASTAAAATAAATETTRAAAAATKVTSATTPTSASVAEAAPFFVVRAVAGKSAAADAEQSAADTVPAHAPGRAGERDLHPCRESAGPLRPMPDSDGPRGAEKQGNSRYLSRALRRSVAERDQFQCTFVSAEGFRCDCRCGLEYHHLVPVSRGGPTTVESVTLRCRVHHSHQTKLDFGEAKVAAAIAARRTHQAQARLWAPTAR